MKINKKNIKWAFWQQSWMYDFGDGYVCLFTDGAKKVVGNNPVTQSSGQSIIVVYGTFALYKTFIMANATRGIDKTRPLYRITLTNDTETLDSEAFKALGIEECYNRYHNTPV